MTRKNIFVSLGIAVLVGVLLAANFGMTAIQQARRNEMYKELEIFADSLAFVQAAYVDEVPPKDLMYGALTGLLGSLDPHSQFLTPEEYDELKVDTAGRFGGVGIEITLKDHLITIITPIEDTPAWDAGLEPNDRIVKIDETVVRNFTLNDAVKMLRGKPGTDVTVVVWREKEGKLLTFVIKRAMIEVKDIKEARILEDGIAYIKLVEFSEDTPGHLDRALADLTSRGMNALILDLRNNPGGLLDRAVEVTERFVSSGKEVVSIKGRDPAMNQAFRSRFKKPYTDIPMIVLVNEGSASGSEILAGCLKDQERAILMGSRTFGKGSVQTVLPLRDGSALKLTTSLYYTPSGASIHEKGISPDIDVARDPGSPALQGARGVSPEEIFDTIDKTAPQKDETSGDKELIRRDAPLARAVDVLKGIKIYQQMLMAKKDASVPHE